MITFTQLRDTFHRDEFKSDIFAAEILRDSYGFRNPSYTVYNTLREINSIMFPNYLDNNPTLFDVIENELFNIHPSNDERVKLIARFIDRY